MTRLPLAAPFVLLMAACSAPSGEAGDESAREMPAGVPDDPLPGTVAPGAMPVPGSSARTDGATTAANDSEADLCGASKVQSFVGRESTVPVRNEVAQEAGSASDRWIYPDSVVTMDRRLDRLTVTMERGTDRILSIECG